MRTAPLALFWIFTVYAFVLRTAVRRLTRGDGGVRGVTTGNGPAALAAGLLLVPSWLLVGLAPVLQPATPRPAGLLVSALGVAVALWSQRVMGRSWRIGVAPDERTALVTDGPFRWVRNPFFTGMSLVAAGTTAAAPTWIGAAATLALFATLAVQVRQVEEPHLARAFGPDYAAYARRTGRFLPGIGRIV